MISQLAEIFTKAKPEIMYTHVPTDKHLTHVCVSLATIMAIRRLPAHLRPRKVYGCEVWRNLDWVDDDDRIILDVTDH